MHLKRILFVDEDAHLLSGLECMLYRLRSQWDMSFANTSEAALALVRESAFDVVVADMRMRGTDGLGLLAEVRERSPATVRIILSSSADRDLALRAVGVAHQFLAKPCGAEELKGAVQRSLAQRELLTSERVARVVSRLHSLPPVPELYIQIQRVLADPGGSIEDVGRIIARDVAMSAKVLQLVNSAFFGLPRRQTNAVEATTYLGFDAVTALALTSQIFAQPAALDRETLELLWTHSLRVGSAARTIAKLEGLDARSTDQAFIAGMLHEIGLLLLANEMKDELTEAWKYARRFGVPLWESERRVIGASHATIGAYLMGLWGLPDPVVQAIGFHHTPAGLPQEGFSLVTAVHAATVLDCGADGCALGETEKELDLGYLEQLRLAARYPVWSKECARLTEVRKAS